MARGRAYPVRDLSPGEDCPVAAAWATEGADHPPGLSDVAGSRRPRVFIADSFPSRATLERTFELVPEAVGVEAIVSFRTTVVDASMFDRAGPSLKLVVNFAVGVENVDTGEAARRGIAVANTPAVSTADVALHTLGLMLSLMRNIARGDRLIRTGDSAAFAQGKLVGRSLNGARVGIVGPGRIGTEVGRLVTACGAMPVYAARGELETLIGSVDVLSLHCPLNEETWHLVDGPVLGRLGDHVFIVNVARGAIVDEYALVDALQTGRIAGAALDVFEFEPQIVEALLGFENVVMTPHIGAATVETRKAKAALVTATLADVLLHGLEPVNRVC